MKPDSQHISFERLVDLAENRSTSDVQPESMHLSTCKRCTIELQRLGQLLNSMRSDREPDAPRDLIAYAVAVFKQKPKQSLVRRLIAALTFDSSSNLTPVFGVRSGQTTSRQLIYSAETNDIELRISPQGDRIVVIGQVLGQDCAGSEVTLTGSSDSATTVLNDLCEFSLPPVLPGTYALLLSLKDVEVEIPQIELTV